MWTAWTALATRIWSAIAAFFRRLAKGILRRTTGLCELQRVCYGERAGAPRAFAVERSLRRSRDPRLRAMVAHLDEVADGARFGDDARTELLAAASRLVMRAKRIDPRLHPDFAASFETAAGLVWGHRQTRASVERLRTTPYDSDDPSHEERLLRLWDALMPGDPLPSRVSKRWQDVGFQGDDPKTDFRGMGLLGLENLLYFAREFPAAAAHVLGHSTHPKYGYTFAVVGINLTSMALSLLRDGSARTFAYNSCPNLGGADAFHRLYCYLFYEFDRHWIESKPRDMMEFSEISRRFEADVRRKMRDRTAKFGINLKVDNV